MLPADSAKIQAAFETPRSSWRDLSGFLGMMGGVVLPIAAMGTELVFHLCRGVFFDPLPTFLHILLVALVPLANLWILLSPDMGQSGRGRWMAWLNGGAIGVSAFYSLIFIPLLPIGAIAVIWFGIGLLILSPPLALAASVGLRRRLSRFTAAKPAGTCEEKPRGLWPGFFCAVGLLALIEMPSTFTRLGMKWAASEDRIGACPGRAHVAGARGQGDDVEALLRLAQPGHGPHRLSAFPGQAGRHGKSACGLLPGAGRGVQFRAASGKGIEGAVQLRGIRCGAGRRFGGGHGSGAFPVRFAHRRIHRRASGFGLSGMDPGIPERGRFRRRGQGPDRVAAGGRGFAAHPVGGRGGAGGGVRVARDGCGRRTRKWCGGAGIRCW